MKTLKITFALTVVALFFSGCEGGYVTGGYAGPYVGIWGPYGGGDFVIGGYGYHHYYGWHHFYGRTLSVHHFTTSAHTVSSFHAGGFHGGSFHGGGHR